MPASWILNVRYLMRVYLDNCAFNRPFDDQSQSRIRVEAEAVLAIREKIESNAVELVWSYVIDLEIAGNPFPLRRQSAETWKDLSIIEIAPSIKIVSEAIELRNRGLREIDALHVACAIASKSHYFITTDDGILKKSAFVENITVANPIEFFELINEL